MVVCPKCGNEFEPNKLICKRCGHEWYQRNPHKLPKVCPNPKCKSPYWDRERMQKKSEKSIKEESNKTIDSITNIKDEYKSER